MTSFETDLPESLGEAEADVRARPPGPRLQCPDRDRCGLHVQGEARPRARPAQDPRCLQSRIRLPGHSHRPMGCLALPCNVVLWEVDGTTRVAIADPRDLMTDLELSVLAGECDHEVGKNRQSWVPTLRDQPDSVQRDRKKEPRDEYGEGSKHVSAERTAWGLVGPYRPLARAPEGNAQRDGDDHQCPGELHHDGGGCCSGRDAARPARDGVRHP